MLEHHNNAIFNTTWGHNVVLSERISFVYPCNDFTEVSYYASVVSMEGFSYWKLESSVTTDWCYAIILGKHFEADELQCQWRALNIPVTCASWRKANIQSFVSGSSSSLKWKRSVVKTWWYNPNQRHLQTDGTGPTGAHRRDTSAPNTKYPSKWPNSYASKNKVDVLWSKDHGINSLSTT